MSEEREIFQEKLGYRFADQALLEKALTHSSFTREQDLPRTMCNERLEFLGDAFFDAIIGEELFDRFPDEPEGNLTKYRAAVVCEESLAKVGGRLGIGDALQLSHGEHLSGGRQRASIVADATEAVIGALYKDAGYEIARDLVLSLFAGRMEDAVSGRLHSDYKSDLQEQVQKKGPADIEYRLLGEEGPDHDKTFFVQVQVDGRPWGEGQGRSKKEAEQQAAKAAMSKGE